MDPMSPHVYHLDISTMDCYFYNKACLVPDFDESEKSMSNLICHLIVKFGALGIPQSKKLNIFNNHFAGISIKNKCFLNPN